MTAIEIAATLLGIANILLLVFRSAWNYPFGLATVALSAPVFFTQRLYSDGLLQIFFFLIQLYGRWNWLRGQAKQGDIVVERLGRQDRMRWAAGVLIAWALWSIAMARWTDTLFPFWDGAVAALSVAAQILQARRLIESWVLWIAVDLIAIGLFVVRGLVYFPWLYGLMLVMSAWGLVTWLRVERRQRQTLVT